MSNKNSTADDLRTEMNRLGAREFEVVALLGDPVRALAALQVAQNKGAQNPIAYATKLYENEEWQPSGESRRSATNLVAEVKCPTCNGDRFVFVLDDPTTLYGETVKPCPSCNASLDASFWKADGTRFVPAS